MIGAFNQLQTYKNQIPALFKTNSLLVISDGLTAQIGSLTSDFERFMPWRTADGKEIAKMDLVRFFNDTCRSRSGACQLYC
jgi:type I restriction enzyme R subunit